MFRFQLISITGSKFDGDVYEVVLPTADGQIGVLSRHMPLFSVVTNGVIMVRLNRTDPDYAREFFATNGGVIDVNGNFLRVLVDEADKAEDINLAEAEAALERAKTMKAEAKDQISLANAQELIDRHEVRLHVATLKHRHQRPPR